MLDCQDSSAAHLLSCEEDIVERAEPEKEEKNDGCPVRVLL